MQTIAKCAALAGLVLLSACASYPEEEANFRFAAAAPLRDFNIAQQPIPGQLNALYQPYGYVDQTGCTAWTREIDELQAALEVNEGRRVGFRRDNETFVGRTGNLRDVGVAALASSAIPLRGVVRQASGASRFQQRAEQASDRARYRIGYLVGLGRAHRCPGFGTLQQVQPVTVSPQYRPQTYPAHPRQAGPRPVTTLPHGASVRRGAARPR
jgi:hypothetical protein